MQSFEIFIGGAIQLFYAAYIAEQFINIVGGRQIVIGKIINGISQIRITDAPEPAEQPLKLLFDVAAISALQDRINFAQNLLERRLQFFKTIPNLNRRLRARRLRAWRLDGPELGGQCRRFMLQSLKSCTYSSFMSKYFLPFE